MKTLYTILMSIYNLIFYPITGKRCFRISGNSMAPALLDGSYVFIDERSYIHTRPIIGHMILATHPVHEDMLIIKRIHAVVDDHRFDVRGDNPDESSDSRSFGAIHLNLIKGRVVSKILKTDRRLTQE